VLAFFRDARELAPTPERGAKVAAALERVVAK